MSEEMSGVMAMLKKVIVNGAILVLLVINIGNIVQKGPNVMNVMAIIVCGICLALHFVDRIRDE